MKRNLLLSALLIFSSVVQADNSHKIEAEILITGQIVDDACSTSSSDYKNMTSQQFINELSQNCYITGTPNNQRSSKVRISTFTPKHQSTNMHNVIFHLSEYI